MTESEGVTEQAREWRTDVAARFAAELGLDSIMFEAADPRRLHLVREKLRPPGEPNLFVDHSQIIQLECPPAYWALTTPGAASIATGRAGGCA